MSSEFRGNNTPDSANEERNMSVVNREYASLRVSLASRPFSATCGSLEVWRAMYLSSSALDSSVDPSSFDNKTVLVS